MRSAIGRIALALGVIGASVTPSAAAGLGIKGARFTIDGEPTFLLGMSYYAALGAPREFIERDLDDMQRLGYNWIRVWATWAGFGADISAVDAEGRPRPEYLERLRWLVAECDRRGMVVDVTLTRGDGSNGSPRLQTLDGHRRALESIIGAIKPHRNWYIDLSNERNIGDARFTSIEDLRVLAELVRRLDPRRLVTASQGGDIGPDEMREYLEVARLDFICPHRPRGPGTAAETAERTRRYFEEMKAIGRPVPIHYQEPFRRGYGDWQPSADDFLADASAAHSEGAAGWCFHNGDQRDGDDGRPRRSFDLRERRLFDQLDPVEREVVARLPAAVGEGPP